MPTQANFGLRVLDLRGLSPRERGRCQGEELREDLRNLPSAWIEFLVREKHLTRGAARREDWGAQHFSILYSRYIPLAYREEMRGVAEAANIPYRFIRLINTFDELYRYLKQRPTRGCSGVAGPDIYGDIIAGDNQDFGALVEVLSKWRVLLRYDRFASLQPCPGFIGVVQGMSDAGVFATVHACNTKKARIAMPRAILVRMAFEAGNNLDDTCRVITDHGDYPVGTLIFIGDSKEARVVEVAPDKAIPRGPDFGRFLALTNHFTVSELLPQQATEYWTPGCQIQDYKLSQAFSGERKNAILSTIRGATFLDHNLIVRALRAVSHEGTVQSVIFEPAKRIMRIAVGGRPAPYGEFETHYLNRG